MLLLPLRACARAGAGLHRSNRIELIFIAKAMRLDTTGTTSQLVMKIGAWVDNELQKQEAEQAAASGATSSGQGGSGDNPDGGGGERGDGNGRGDQGGGGGDQGDGTTGGWGRRSGRWHSRRMGWQHC